MLLRLGLTRKDRYSLRFVGKKKARAIEITRANLYSIELPASAVVSVIL